MRRYPAAQRALQPAHSPSSWAALHRRWNGRVRYCRRWARTFHVGDNGAGQVAKLCNNMALGVIMAATGEAIALGVAQGLDPAVLSQMMAVSTGRSWATEVCNPWPGVLENAPASRGYSGGFGNDLMLKDLGLVAEAAVQAGASIPLGELARNLYAMNSRAGNGGLDFSSVVKLVAKV